MELHFRLRGRRGISRVWAAGAISDEEGVLARVQISGEQGAARGEEAGASKQVRQKILELENFGITRCGFLVRQNKLNV